MQQLLGERPLDMYDVCVPLTVKLRPYQQEGLNWLGFLNRFNLHGVLCDEMGE